MSSVATAGAQPVPKTTHTTLTKNEILMEAQEVIEEKVGEGGGEEGEEEEEEEEEEEDEREEEEGEPEGDEGAAWTAKMHQIRTTLFSQTYAKEFMGNKGRQGEFLQEFGAIFARKPPNEQNSILHLLAWTPRYPRPWLLKHMLEHHKERMEDISEGKRPLTLAIFNKNEAFIKTVLKSKHVRRDLVKLLGAKREDTENGIHLAIKTGLSPELTLELISKVTDEVLSQRNAAGLTPLHLAVEYERCTEAQLDVVKALLKHGDSALDLKTKVTNLSVYRHHLSTRPKEREAVPAAQGPPPAQRTAARWGHPAAPDSAQAVTQQVGQDQAPGNNKENDKKKMNQAKDNQGNKPSGDLNVDRSQIQTPVGPALGASPWPTGTMVFNAQGTAPSTIMIGGPGQQPANVTALRRVPTQPLATSQDHTPDAPPARPARPAAKEGQSPDDGTDRMASAERIAHELKLHYLRSTFEKRADGKERAQKEAMEFLYGDSRNAKEIYFNLLQKDGRPTELHEDALSEKGYNQLNFDTVLRFVAVGPLEIKPRGVPPDQSGDSRGTGRKDLTKLFKWLKEKGEGVKNIIHVRVEDHEASPHTDQAIIKALKDFEIDILDWTKPDLCPKTIREACPKVRKLYLTWSGLNGMLLAWGGPEGLANLEDLTDIYIRQTKHLEPPKWTKKKLAEFEKNLQDSIPAEKEPETKASPTPTPTTPAKNEPGTKAGNQKPRRVIKVHPPEQLRVASTSPQNSGKDNSHQQPQNGTRQETSKDSDGHEWLNIMDRFGQAIRDLVPDQARFNDLPAALKPEVRICLIDDGVDYDDGISVRMEPGQAFGTESSRDLPGMTVPYYRSATQHGTLMARMMLRVCPNARIVPYRLDTKLGEDGLMHPTAKSAADALEHAAASKNFDIVSMSWCIKEQPDNAKDVGRIITALGKVAKEKLVFCSSPDVGSISPEQLQYYYPIGHKDSWPLMFRIGAATADGRTWEKVGGANVVDYTLPGHKVRSLYDSDLEVDTKTSLNTGSSIATALAAGLAALMIHIVRMAAVRTHEHVHVGVGVGGGSARQPDSWDDGSSLLDYRALRPIKSRDKMRELFQDMARHSSGTYVHVWPRFGGKVEELENIGDEVADSVAARWKILTQLARDIISSKDMVPNAAGRFLSGEVS